MLLAQTVGYYEVLCVVVYLAAVTYLGYLGYRRTQSAADYLVAGRKAHPAIMALSYGATFISTSAIVGFGGVAGLFGMSVLWLTVFNILVGIFVAFVVLGGPTRRIGHRLDAHTFPELLSKRFDSRFIHIFAGLVIFFFMPLYASAVLIGGAEFLAKAFGIDYNVALLIFGGIVAMYVVAGGLKGVMYTDALQGGVMFVGMALLLVFGYAKLGGVAEAHRSLSSLSDMVPKKLADMGHSGWTAMPPFGFGDSKYDLWWIVISTITLGVGIGVLAQPQLVVRFMTVKSKRDLNRAVPTGGIFIICMTGVAFTVGALSNAYFTQHGPPLTGRVLKPLKQPDHAVLQVMQQTADGKWEDVKDKLAPVVLADGGKPVATSGTTPIVRGRSISIVYARGSADQIIPEYITRAMPSWFGVLFLLTLLAAAMSTLSSQFHTLGTAIGRDVYGSLAGPAKGTDSGHSMYIVRIGMVVGIVVAVTFAYYLRGRDYIIARFTAIFFGLCAATFLPAFVGGLFSRRITKAGAIASMLTGFVVCTFWLVLVKAQEAGALGLVQKVTGGKSSILEGHPNWPVVDSIVIGLPLSIVAAVLVSLVTRPPDKAHLDRCFGANRPGARG